MFPSIDDVVERFRAHQYLCSRNVATVVFLASKLRRPILVEGPAGVGKTDLGQTLARSVGVELVRLQCYEGLDETKALYEWEYAKQLLYTQILKDKIGEVLAGTGGLRESVERLTTQEDVFFSERFLLSRPLLKVIREGGVQVLLIDEIDKADPEFEAFLLEFLSDFQVSVPEIGTFKAKERPLVILTSNNTRELSDALKRRCLHLFLDFPEEAMETEIVRMKVPEAGPLLTRQVVKMVHGLREMDLKKVPSISEALDWARALALLNVGALDDAIVRDTLGLVLKHEVDVKKAREQIPRLVSRLPSAAGGAE
ncbi:MAG: MoxR family ATPase [Deltaproteobacteria bacterium]|nr:MoxR family ATPase [Deltaproteobacteria bacterium]